MPEALITSATLDPWTRLARPDFHLNLDLDEAMLIHGLMVLLSSGIKH